jgi:hypothetical protein
MCHLCRKIEGLGRIDSKVTKPIFVLLSALHKQVEFRLGDIWLWRYDKTTKLRTLLGKLHTFVPLSALQELLDDVDKQLQHIEKNMPEHLPLHSTGRWDALKLPVTPSQSASGRWLREEKLEKSGIKRQRKSERGEEAQVRTRQAPEAISEKFTLTRSPQPELQGSDIEPSNARKQQSTQLVEEWFKRCVAVMAGPSCKDCEAVSLVSEALGGVRERPKENHAAFGKMYNRRSRNGHSSTASGSTSGSHNLHETSRTHADCILDAPIDKFEPDADIFGHLGKAETLKGRSRITQDLGSLLRHRKVEKLSKMYDISITAAIEALEAKKMHQGQKHIMLGVRSDSTSAKASMELLEPVAGTNRPRISVESSAQKDSVTATRSDIRKCLDISDVGFHIDENSDASLLSSRGSPPNVGSLIEQPRSLCGKTQSRVQSGKSPQMRSPSLRSSLSSAPRMPIAIGRAPSPAEKQRPAKAGEVRTSHRETRQALEIPFVEVGIIRGSGRQDIEHSYETRKGTEPGDEQVRGMGDDSTLSKAIKKSRQRRAERALNSLPSNDRYRHEERSKTWGPEKP